MKSFDESIKPKGRFLMEDYITIAQSPSYKFLYITTHINRA